MHKKGGYDYLFYSYFDYLCKRKGVTKNKACQEMGVSRSVAAKWKSTQTNPNMATLQKISDYFGVSIDELLAQGEEKPATNGDGQENLTFTQRELIKMLPQLSESDCAVLLATARAQADAHKTLGE